MPAPKPKRRVLSTSSISLRIRRRVSIRQRSRWKWLTFSLFKDAFAVFLGVVGLYVGVYQFWYLNIYQVSQLPPILNLTCSLQEHGAKGPLSVFQATVTMKNESKTTVYALASWFNVKGATVATSSDIRSYEDETATQLAQWQDNLDLVTRSMKYSSLSPEDVIARGSFLPPVGVFFQPGEESTVTFAVYIPREKFELVRLEADTLISKTAYKFSSPPIVKEGDELTLSQDAAEQTYGGKFPTGVGEQTVSDKSSVAVKNPPHVDQFAVVQESEYELPLWHTSGEPAAPLQHKVPPGNAAH